MCLLDLPWCHDVLQDVGRITYEQWEVTRRILFLHQAVSACNLLEVVSPASTRVGLLFLHSDLESRGIGL